MAIGNSTAVRVKTELSVTYAYHNTLQTEFEKPDDHVLPELTDREIKVICPVAVELDRPVRKGQSGEFRP